MEENRSRDGRMESQKVGEAWTDYTQKQSEWKGAGQFLTLSDCSSEWKLSVMVQLNICACQEGDKLWQLQWAWIFVVIQKNKNQTKPMQYIPIAAVPMTNIRSPQTTLLHRGRKGEFNDRASSGKTTRFCYCIHSWLQTQKQLTKSLEIFGTQNTSLNI